MKNQKENILSKLIEAAIAMIMGYLIMGLLYNFFDWLIQKTSWKERLLIAAIIGILILVANYPLL